MIDHHDGFDARGVELHTPLSTCADRPNIQSPVLVSCYFPMAEFVRFFRFVCRALCIGLLTQTPLTTAAQAETTIIRMAFPAGAKEIFTYEFGVIELALAHADADYVLEVEEISGLTQSRLSNMLAHGKVDLMFSGYSAQRETDFLQVDIPLTRGILGHRVFMTRADKIDALKRVTTIEQLQMFCIGAGNDWPDIRIMEDAGFCVELAMHSKLWEMLVNKRFDLMTRSIHEAYREREHLEETHPEIVLDESVMLVYPFDFFIYVNRKDTGLRQILTNALLKAYDDGTFMDHYNSNPAIHTALEAIGDGRRVFRIENSTMSQHTRNIDDRFWQDRLTPNDLRGHIDTAANVGPPEAPAEYPDRQPACRGHSSQAHPLAMVRLPPHR